MATLLSQVAPTARRVTVTRIERNGEVYVLDPAGSVEVLALTLDHSPDTIESIRPGDEVVVLDLNDDTHGVVILGRIARSARPRDEARRAAPVNRRDQRSPRSVASDDRDVPDTLILEASKAVTLRAGDGSITIRADGKILIKGKDLVSQAKNTNRIKGGAVAIN